MSVYISRSSEVEDVVAVAVVSKGRVVGKRSKDNGSTLKKP